MHIKPYLGEEIGRGKSGFAVIRGAGFYCSCFKAILRTYLHLTPGMLITCSSKTKRMTMIEVGKKYFLTINTIFIKTVTIKRNYNSTSLFP